MTAYSEAISIEEVASKLEIEASDAEAMREFKKGLQLIANQYPAKAYAHIKRAAQLEQNNPYFISYLGLLTASTESRWREAVTLCEAALRMRRNQPQLYLNLAQVYLKAGRKEEAVDTLHLGLEILGHDARLQSALARLGNRRPPVLPFLERSHALNRWLGRVRNQVRRMAGGA